MRACSNSFSTLRKLFYQSTKKIKKKLVQHLIRYLSYFVFLISFAHNLCIFLNFTSLILFLILDVSYGYVIDQQPIGRILFRLFCENKRPLYYRYIAFLDYVTRFVFISFKHCSIFFPFTFYRRRRRRHHHF